jgi:hypothetical protein
VRAALLGPTCRIGFLAALVSVTLPGATLAKSEQHFSVSRGSIAQKVQTKYRLCGRKPSLKRYVSTAGSDRNPGSLRHPWRTIKHALGTAVSGESIYLRAGTYTDWATASRSGTATAPISLRPYRRERPLMTGRLKVVGSYFCVTGLRFEGRSSANMIGVLIYPAGAHHVEIFRNRIVNAAMSGIYVGDEGDLSSDVNIIGNYIGGNGTHEKFDHGVYIGHVDGGLIANNVVVGNRALGLKIAPEANNVIITQNTVVSNGTSGIIVGGEENWSSNNDVVVNNIVAYNHERVGSFLVSWWRTGSGTIDSRDPEIHRVRQLSPASQESGSQSSDSRILDALRLPRSKETKRTATGSRRLRTLRRQSRLTGVEELRACC